LFSDFLRGGKGGPTLLGRSMERREQCLREKRGKRVKGRFSLILGNLEGKVEDFRW